MVRVSLPSGLLRAWTGAGEVEVEEPPELNGGDIARATYDGSARLASRLSDRPRFAMRGVRLGSAPLVGSRVEVWLAGWLNDAWRSLLVQHVGLLDSPSIERGVLSFEVRRLDVPPPTRMWAADAHNAALDEPDSIFAQLKALRKGIRRAPTQPPPFREDGAYDGLALALRPWEASATGATTAQALVVTTAPQRLISGPPPAGIPAPTRAGARAAPRRPSDSTLPRGW